MRGGERVAAFAFLLYSSWWKHQHFMTESGPSKEPCIKLREKPIEKQLHAAPLHAPVPPQKGPRPAASRKANAWFENNTFGPLSGAEISTSGTDRQTDWARPVLMVFEGHFRVRAGWKRKKRVIGMVGDWTSLITLLEIQNHCKGPGPLGQQT